MDDERWLELVARLEARAERDPRRYRRRVARFAALGYAYIAVALAAVLGLAVLVVYVGIHHGLLLKLLLPIGGLALLILRSLSVRIDPPDGIPVSRAEAPALYDAIDEVRRDVRGPSLHAVLIDGDMNAAIVQVPRFGIFGSHNYLVLGLPLMQALTPTEFRAVLAHEMAHLSRRHGRLVVWLYRVSSTWRQLLAALEEKQSAATGLFRHFFEWYVPRFNALTFPLMRAHEFEADRIAAGAAGADALGRALGRLAICDGFVSARYWPSVFARTGDDPAPPSTAFTQLAERVRAAAADESCEEWLDAALLQEPEATDSHPGLARRLASLGLEPDAVRVRADDPERSADAYLGAHAATVAGRLDARWQREVARRWTQEHKRVRSERAELQALEQRSDGGLDRDELMALAELTEAHRGSDEALARYRQILEAHPDDALARFSVGRILLDDGDDAGLAELDRAMELDPDAILPVSQVAAAYLTKCGRDEDAQRYAELGSRRLASFAAAMTERASFTFADPFGPAELTPETARALERTLAAFPEVESAYVGLRSLEHLAEELPTFVVFVVADKPEPKGVAPLVARLVDAIELPGYLHVLVRRNRNEDIKRFTARVPTPTYRRA